MSNLDFQEKFQLYFAPDHTSPFGLKQAIQSQTQWTPGVITRPSRTMIGQLAQIWGLHGPGNPSAARSKDGPANSG